MRVFINKDTLRKLPFSLADIAVILGVFVLLVVVAKVGAGAFVPFQPSKTHISISLNPRNLPYYAARSTLRMFIALGFSFLFTMVYGYIAAHNRRAEKILIPLLDILQSVPVLGFLSITVTGFIALFSGSLIGLEAASIFAIFTSQVWNMTFFFYHSLKTLPNELVEASTLYRLTRWQRFTRLELPYSIIGLVWNAMMSFGGGWFFVTASEAISVLNHTYVLPGIGSYLAIAVKNQNMHALAYALLTMAIVIVIVDQLFWRPLIAWSDKFRLEQSASADVPNSWVFNLLQASKISRLAGKIATVIDRFINRLFPRFDPVYKENDRPKQKKDWLFNSIMFVVIGVALVILIRFILESVGLAEVGKTIYLGFVTFGRVIVLLIFATIIWTPIGVAIGFHPKLARILQPVVQFLASFPANFLFPFATLFFIKEGISINWGGILLMALGAQWYILFNTIAGAMSIPTELREMASNLGIRGWKLWKSLIIPGIFSSWVTGGITAAGGAWNASIIAEVVNWGHSRLVATGLGAYIAQATLTGAWPKIALGVGMMSIFVVGLNQIFWRRLYKLSETKFRLD